MSILDAHSRLVEALRTQSQLAAALHLLEWDQETFMPSGVAESRAEQIGTLATVLHDQETNPAFAGLVDDLAARLEQLTPEQAVDVRETKWRLDRRRALDPALVRERAVLHAQSRSAWMQARCDDDFSRLAPYLTRIVDLERRVASAIAPQCPLYDALLEEYEPGAATATILPVFEELRTGLLPLVQRLRRRLDSRPLTPRALQGHFPAAAQRRFNRRVAEGLGFDFTKGRLDEAAHPFTTAIGNDIRLTTRYDEADLGYALFSTIHETGHGLYEQGLDPDAAGTPRGESCSLGIHESQSRLWENFVGRTPSFWSHFLPPARQEFAALADVGVDDVLLFVNQARPSLIRTEADEITYNLHILLRFDLERDLIEKKLAVGDLPDAWREKMAAYLGVVPTSHRDGVLQDVHWASGAIGYFPTYTLGNIYAAQLMAAAEAELGPIASAPEPGSYFAALLAWLRRRVHRFGQTHRAPDLVASATGRAPSCHALLGHLERKLSYLESA